MDERWIECPCCHTGYQPQRLGVALDRTKQITIVCQVCHKAFDVNVAVVTTWEQTSRWNPFKQEVTTVSMEAKERVS